MGCAERGNNTLGLSLIEDQSTVKAVRTLVLSAPDSSADFQLTASQGSSGQAADLLFGLDSGILARALLRFDVAPLPDSGQSALLDTAWVRFFFDEASGSTQMFSAAVHRIASPWSESLASADSLPLLQAPSDTVSFAFIASGDSADIPLTDLTRFWIDHPDSALGIALIPGPTASGLFELFSAESARPPVLTATWNPGAGDSTVHINPADDMFFLHTTSAFVPLTSEPGRLAVARGIPARSLLRFAIPDLGPRVTVNRAELTVFTDLALSQLHDFTLGVQRVTADPWNDALTSVDPFLDGTEAGEAPLVDASTDSVRMNVTFTVSNLIESGNFGMLVRAASEIPDAEFVRFHAHDSSDSTRRPRLKIWYTPGDVGGQE
jgi:hypothetical protein